MISIICLIGNMKYIAFTETHNTANHDPSWDGRYVDWSDTSKFNERPAWFKFIARHCLKIDLVLLPVFYWWFSM